MWLNLMKTVSFALQVQKLSNSFKRSAFVFFFFFNFGQTGCLHQVKRHVSILPKSHCFQKVCPQQPKAAKTEFGNSCPYKRKNTVFIKLSHICKTELKETGLIKLTQSCYKKSKQTVFNKFVNICTNKPKQTDFMKLVTFTTSSKNFTKPNKYRRLTSSFFLYMCNVAKFVQK